MSKSNALPEPPEMHQNATECSNEKKVRQTLDHIPRNDQELSPRQQKAIPLMLQGFSDVQVAQQIGVDRTTLYRWRSEEAFAAELDEQRRLLWEQSVARLQSLIDPALNILQKQITGDDPKTALRAASILLRVATPARMHRLIEEQAAPAPEQSPEDDFMDQVEAYINAPLPNEPGHPNYRAPSKLDSRMNPSTSSGQAR